MIALPQSREGCIPISEMQDPIEESQWNYGDQIGAQPAAKQGVQTGRNDFSNTLSPSNS